MNGLKKMRDFYQRVVIYAFVIALVSTLIYFSDQALVSWILAIFLASLAGIGVWEYVQLTKAKGLQPLSRLMVGVTCVEVIALYISIIYPAVSTISLIVMVLGFISFFVAHFRNPHDAILHLAVELFGVCYLAVPFCFILMILNSPAQSSSFQDGRWWMLYLIAVTKVTDMGGYFIGKIFGRHLLATQLSPKKTIEGAVGGFACAVLTSVTMSVLGSSLANSAFRLSLGDSIWMGILIGSLAQIGDLAESSLKRDAVVKDSNKLPALGGVLDIVDSLLLTSPVVYFFMRSLHLEYFR